MKKNILLIATLSFAFVTDEGHAESGRKRNIVAEVPIDIDRDGKPDRVFLTEFPDSGDVDLFIYKSVDVAPKEVGANADFVRKSLLNNGMDGPVSGGEASNNSLVIKYGWPGSNTVEKTLTIANREGKYLIGGYSLAYDTRSGQGGCEINYLTGKAFTSEFRDGSDRRMPLRGNFKPIELSKWTPHDLPSKCVSK